MVKKHEDILLNHEYDGIREYDNPTPGWWNWLFILSAVFAPLYIFAYHVGPFDLPKEEYTQELKAHLAYVARVEKERGTEAISESALSTMMNDSSALAMAKAKWDLVCVACHGADGEGKIGPNLTDDYWIHGQGNLQDIYQVISEGVVAKGMPAWNRLLKPEELTAMTAFVGTMRGKNLAGKEPQGEKVGGSGGAAPAQPESDTGQGS